jgi:hypothetical protein
MHANLLPKEAICEATYLLNDVIDGCHRGVVSDSVTNADGHTMLQQPVVDCHSAQVQEQEKY